MALQVEHELHRRRASRNLGLLVVLLAFAAIIFGLTIAKVTSGASMKGWDHRLDNALLPENNGGAHDAPPAPAPAMGTGQTALPVVPDDAPPAPAVVR